MELYQSQAVKYYLILDPEFNKVELYELVDDVYKLISTNPLSFKFTLKADCTLEVFFNDIWE